MPGLHELQRACLAAFSSGSDHGLQRHLIDNAIPATTRIEVYRNNWQETFRKTLTRSYSVVERLVGADCFRMLARKYATLYPSSSGDLQDFGTAFAELLRDEYAGGDYAYLPDVARLEWAIEEALIRPRSTDLDAAAVARLAELTPGDFEFLRVSVQASLQLIRSRFPVLAIWRANQPGRDETVDLSGGPDYLAVRRVGDEAEIRRIDENSYELLRSAAAGCSLGDILDRHFSNTPGDFAKALQAAVRGGFVREFVFLPAD